jgi:hypothetical protein
MTRLLLIGAGGLDWGTFDARTRPEAGADALPALSALRARGVAGWLGGAPQTIGPAAWASIATGVQPEVHGVWREQEEWAGGLRPTGKASWRVAPLWARLEAAGISTGSVGWRGIRPGSAWAGLHIDDEYAEATGTRPQDWAMPRRCMPYDLRETLRSRRVHVMDITATMLAPLVPDIASVDQSRDDGLPMIALGMARAATIQSAAVWMMSEREGGAPDAVFVHQPWLGRIRYAFEGRRETQFAGVLAAAWRFLDGLVGRLAALAGPETAILLVSPGWKGAPGVVLALGAGVEPAAGFHGAGLLDVAPSALARFDLEDRGLPGRRFAPAMASWLRDRPLTPAPRPPPDPPAKPDALMVYALRKHGYRPPPRRNPAWMAQGLADLALMVLERDAATSGRIADAALRQDGGCILALRVKARASLALDDAVPLPGLGDALIAAAPDRGWGPLAHGAYHVLRGERAKAEPWLRKAEADPDPATLLTVAAVWLAASRPASAERVFKAVLDNDPSNVAAEIGIAMGALDRRDFMTAESALRRALKQDPGRPALYLHLAQIYARTARKPEAARYADIALRLGAPAAVADAARTGRLRA